MDGGLASVVIPCFNQGRFLGDAIESALEQTYPHLEVVVVDDGSEDNTSEIARSFPGVRCIRQQNLGLSAARNAGLRHSSGSAIAFLDADDLLLPGAVAAGVTQLRVHPECMFVAGGYRFIAADGSEAVQEPPHGVRENYYCELLKMNFITMHGAALYRREVFELLGGFDVQLNACEDYEFYLRVARNFPIHCYDEIVADYRRHDGAMTRDLGRMLTTGCRVLQEQSRYVDRNVSAAEALEVGIQNFKKFYGEQLVERVQADAAKTDWKKVAAGLKLLVDFYPYGLKECEAALAQTEWPCLTRNREIVAG